MPGLHGSVSKRHDPLRMAQPRAPTETRRHLAARQEAYRRHEHAGCNAESFAVVFEVRLTPFTPSTLAPTSSTI